VRLRSSHRGRRWLGSARARRTCPAGQAASCWAMKRDERRAVYAVGMLLFPAATLFTRWFFQAKAGTQGAAWAPAAEEWLTLGQAAVALLSTVLFAVAMEYYARYAHEHWWHGDALWFIHRTHHEPRTTILEANDVFGVLNAAVVMPVLMQAYFAQASYGVALRLGASMGISIFGCAYIVVHDGVHHERFWSGPLQSVEWFRKISEAHRAHHKKDHCAPFGLFLGPQELACVQAGKQPPGLPAVMRLGLMLWVMGLLGTITGDILAQPA
jgi:beta-carotene 3-hydroxylase